MGFSIRWRWLVLCRLRRCSGETRCRTGHVPLGKRPVTHPIREYEGEIFTDYYFGEANTVNKSDNYHNNAINENLNWGGISGLLQLATTNSGSRPEIQDGPGGRGEKRETTKNSTPPTRRDSTPRRRRTSDEKLPQRN